VAGADWPEDFRFLRHELEARTLGRAVAVYNDAMGPLRSGSANFTGVAVVCGTGGATGGRGPEGRIWHASWWQDTQGSRALGGEALWAIYHAELGIAPPTALTTAILAQYGEASVEALLHRFTARLIDSRPGTEAAGRVLVREAEAGDAVAAGIIRSHGARLGEYALAVARRVGLGIGPLTVVMDGTVLRHSPLMRTALLARIQEERPEVSATVPTIPPAAGALLLALQGSQNCLSPRIENQVRATLPTVLPE